MTTLHLGVIDISYSDTSYQQPRSPKARLGAAKRGKVTAAAPASNMKTTGEVAEILEAKYHIMETFFELHETEIVGMLERSLEGALQNIAAGAPGTIGVNAEGESAIEATFKNWLSQRGMDQTATPGVPTLAALHGVSHRFAHPYARRASRPSFIDTGLYQANFKAWVD